jgi:hypothetical protein
MDGGMVGVSIRAGGMPTRAVESVAIVVSGRIGRTEASAVSERTAASVARAATVWKLAVDVTEDAIAIAVATGVATRIGVTALGSVAVSRTHRAIEASPVAETEIAMQLAPTSAALMPTGLMRIAPVNPAALTRTAPVNPAVLTRTALVKSAALMQIALANSVGPKPIVLANSTGHRRTRAIDLPMLPLAADPTTFAPRVRSVPTVVASAKEAETAASPAVAGAADVAAAVVAVAARGRARALPTVTRKAADSASTRSARARELTITAVRSRTDTTSTKGSARARMTALANRVASPRRLSTLESMARLVATVRRARHSLEVGRSRPVRAVAHMKTGSRANLESVASRANTSRAASRASTERVSHPNSGSLR